jgi:hypothetical protein
MAQLQKQSATGLNIAAGQAITNVFSEFGQGYSTLDIMGAGSLATGASLTFSVQVSTDGVTWYDANVIDLGGSDNASLVSNVVISSASFARMIMRVEAVAPYVRLSIHNTGITGDAVANIHAVATG